MCGGLYQTKGNLSVFPRSHFSPESPSFASLILCLTTFISHHPTPDAINEGLSLGHELMRICTWKTRGEEKVKKPRKIDVIFNHKKI